MELSRPKAAEATVSTVAAEISEAALYIVA